MKVRNLARGLPLLTILVPGAAWCLGLGDITVNTALNQPLRAEIRVLSATLEDIENLRASLASRQVFDKVGIQRVFALTQLQFNVVPAQDGGATIEVTTRQPVREPFLNFLVEMQWPNGRLLREYTVLLDPPVFLDEQGVVSEAPVVPAEATRPQTVADGGRSASRFGERPGNDASPARANPGSSQSVRDDRSPVSHTVVAGDTLGEIAQRYRRDENIELSRMMVAIWRVNPETFAQGNINDLKTGMILRMPDPQEIAAVESTAAVNEVARQNTLWAEFRAPTAIEPAAEEAASEDAPPAEDAAIAADASSQTNGGQARLDIMVADEAASADGTAGAEAISKASEPGAENGAENTDLLLRELAESRRVEIDSLQTKVAELESMLVKQERVISLQSEALADLQARLDPNVSATDVESPAVDGVRASGAAATAVADVQADAAAADGASTSARTPSGTPDRSPDVEPAAPPPASDSLNAMLANPVMLAGAGAAGLLLLALIWLIVKRAASRTETVDLASYVDNAGDGDSDIDVTMPRSGADVPGEADTIVRTHAPVEPILMTSGTPAHGDADVQAKQHAKPANDDTLAEADVYIAYGLHQQGEDLLKEAIKRNPERTDYRLKLLEIYYAGKNHVAFEAEAKALHDVTGGKRDATWQRVVTMGLELNPRNPLFSGTAAQSMKSDSSASSQATAGEQQAAAQSGFRTKETMAAADAATGLANASQDGGIEDVVENEAIHGELTDIENGTSSGESTPTAYHSKMLEFDMSGLDGETADASSMSSDSSASGDKDELNFDLSGLDSVNGPGDLFDQHQASDGAAEYGDNRGSALPGSSASLIGLDANSFDDTSFSIDLAGVAGENDSRTDAFGNTSSEQDLNPDNDLSDINEVGTKLDLARAYIDMGDSDGAVSTLEEVLQEGDDDQRKQAETLMRQIA